MSKHIPTPIETTPGTCWICGCTADKACEGGCGWTDASETLCTQCQVGINIARIYLQAVSEAYSVSPSFTSHTQPHQQLLAMCGRAIHDAIAERATAEVQDIVGHYADLMNHLAKKYQRETEEAIEKDESLPDLIERLIASGGRRVVIAGG